MESSTPPTRRSPTRRAVFATALPLAALTVGWPLVTSAQDAYPSRPLLIVLAFPTGGVPDTAARLIAEKLGQRIGQTVVVDNRPGASGLLAVQAFRDAPADGYTLFYGDNGNWAITPAMKRSPGYDPRADLVPVSSTASMKFFFFASSAFPIQGVQDLVSLSRSTPGGLSYGTSGVGSIHHLAFERLKLATGANLVHVPFKGVAQTVLSLAAGDIALMVGTPLALQAQLKAGRARTIAVGSARRSSLAPNVPSLADAGILGVEIRADQGIFVRPGTPPAVVGKLNAELQQVLGDAELKRKMAEFGVEMAGSTPDELAALIKSDLANYQAVIKSAGIVQE